MSDEIPDDSELPEGAKLGNEIADHGSEMSSILGDAYCERIGSGDDMAITL